MAKQSKDVEGLSFFFFFFQNIIVSKSILGTSIAREKNGEPTHVLDCITPGGATKKFPSCTTLTGATIWSIFNNPFLPVSTVSFPHLLASLSLCLLSPQKPATPFSFTHHHLHHIRHPLFNNLRLALYLPLLILWIWLWFGYYVRFRFFFVILGFSWTWINEV